MIRKKFVVLLAFSLLSHLLAAQVDGKAKQLLDEAAATFDAYENIRVQFDYIIDDQQRQTTDTVKGTFFMKGDKYKLFFMGNEVFFDGKNMTTLLIEQKEATITTPTKEEQGIMNPAELFTMYKEGYKMRYRQDVVAQQPQYHIIDLYPEDLEAQDFSRVRVRLPQDKATLHSITRYDKSGQHATLVLNEIKSDITLNEALFEFKPGNHPGVEIIDLRGDEF